MVRKTRVKRTVQGILSTQRPIPHFAVACEHCTRGRDLVPTGDPPGGFRLHVALNTLALGATALAYAWYLNGVKVLGAGTAAAYMSLVPLFGSGVFLLVAG